MKPLICNFSSLSTSNGDSIFTSKLVGAIEPLQAVTFHNDLRTPLLPKETNLEAKTKYNEIYWISPKYLKKFFDILQTADVIHLNPFNFSDMLIVCVLKSMQKKILFTMHANIHFKIKNTIKILETIRFIINYNFYVLMADQIVFVTRAQQQSFLAYCPWKKTVQRKAVVIHNAIESQRITHHRTHESSVLSVLFVGRLERSKGIYDLLRVAKQVEREPIHFFVAGRGKLVMDSPPFTNVTFLGNLPNKDIYGVYDRADILIVPSYSEAFPIVILEAMARGLAILASDLPCIREFLQEGRNAYFFPVGDTEAMTSRILHLHQNLQELTQIGENNLVDVRQFTVENQARQYRHLYEELARHD
jgi:glycosyltransferase involved in cell wall biosynthesis